MEKLIPLKDFSVFMNYWGIAGDRESIIWRPQSGLIEEVSLFKQHNSRLTPLISNCVRSATLVLIS